MPGPSDIRVNPFNNATNYVNLTERHIVPSVSPFVVRLNEVPEKQDPSNMQMYYVDDTTGQTTETALTEVAATPGAGEFRPDYSTNAFDDTSWNTGLIEFSSADAGKIIEVSYTATGTLAGVKTNRYPAWWTDRGDGSDGAFNPAKNTTISGEKNYTSVFIKSGVTVSVTHHAIIKCQGSFINLGTISAAGQGASGGSPYNSGQNGYGAGVGAAAGYASQQGGGAGGAAQINGITVSMTIDLQKSMFCARALCNGAGGGGSGRNSNGVTGNGGRGGGCIYITCAEFSNTGTISAAGGAAQDTGAGSAHGGAGGGGAIGIVAGRITQQGTLNVNGGGAGWAIVKEIGE